MKNCPHCQRQLEDGAKFCNYCGEKLEAEVPAKTTPAQEQKPDCPVRREPKKKHRRGRTIAITVGVLLLAALLILGAVLAVRLHQRGTAKNGSYAFFIKDDELFYTDYQKEPFRITEKLMPRPEGVDDASYLIAASWPIDFLRRTEDGSFAFYPDHSTWDSAEITIFCRSLTDREAEPVLISEQVRNYVLQKETNLAYVLETDDTLYRVTAQGEKTQIDTEVGYLCDFDMSVTTLYYVKTDKTLCRLKDDAAGEKLAEGVEQIVRVSEDESTIWYQKGKSLCKMTGDTETEIAQNVDTVAMTYDDGSAYYVRENWIETPLYDFVLDENPTGEGEELVKAPMPLVPDYPEPPTMPNQADYESESEYQAAVQTYNEEYLTYLDAYSKANEQLVQEQAEHMANGGMVNPRNELREELKKETISVPAGKIYYFDGKEEKELSASFDGEMPYAAPDAKVIAFGSYLPDNMPKINLEEVETKQDVLDWCQEKQNEGASFWVAAGGDAKEVWTKDRAFDRVTEDGQVYFFPAADLQADTETQNTFADVTYYFVPITDGKVGEKEVYAEHVDGGGFLFSEDTPPAVITFTGSENGYTGTFYLNGEKVDENVFMYRVESRDGTTAYLKDYDEESYLAKLMLNREGESTLVCESVKSFTLQEDAGLLYLDSDGGLFLLKNGKTTQIADHVMGFEQ